MQNRKSAGEPDTAVFSSPAAISRAWVRERWLEVCAARSRVPTLILIPWVGQKRDSNLTPFEPAEVCSWGSYSMREGCGERAQMWVRRNAVRKFLPLRLQLSDLGQVKVRWRVSSAKITQGCVKGRKDYEWKVKVKQRGRLAKEGGGVKDRGFCGGRRRRYLYLESPKLSASFSAPRL